MTARLRALVLEDEWAARNYLVELLHETARVEVVAAVATCEQATQAASEGVDAAFVDVNLAGEIQDNAGIEWIRSLGASAPHVVLTTASDRHAIEAYSLGVRDYLLKPFTAARVAQCVARLIDRSPPRLSAATVVQRVAARQGQRVVFVRLEDLWAFEASSRLTFAHTAMGRFDVDLSLSALEASLGPAVLRVHRNWLVHRAHVAGLDREGGETVLRLGTGDRAILVPVSRDRAVLVREALLSESVGLRRG
jgi:two-component system response regulator LytT